MYSFLLFFFFLFVKELHASLKGHSFQTGNINALRATHEKGSYAICGQHSAGSAFAQASLGLRCPLTESMDTVVYVDQQRMPKTDCMDALAHPDLRCSHVA